MNTKRAYQQAVPILVKHLSRPYSPRVLEGIVRALTVKEARGVAAEPLIELFQRLPMTGWPKWEIGNAINMVATRPDLPTLERLAMERSHGRDREGILAVFVRLFTPHSDQIVIELLSDPTISHHAAFVAGKRKLAAALPDLRKLLGSSNKDVVKAARKAIEKIEK